jgi:hypothetical protein
MQKLIAEVPSRNQQQGIRWIILEDDTDGTGGWYVYTHRSLDEGSESDSWHLTRADAEREASLRWGIRTDGWRKYSG